MRWAWMRTDFLLPGQGLFLVHRILQGISGIRTSTTWPYMDLFHCLCVVDGRGAVNPKGVEYYNNLIDELMTYGM